jgi:hypothetical protein
LQHLHLPDRGAIADADELIARFGRHAGDEAAARAARSRDLGNLVHFCRWRTVGRVIDLLSRPVPDGTIH